VALAACGQGAGGGAGGDGDSYSWDLTITTGNSSTWHEGATLFAETLEEKSDGRIRVNIFANEQLSGGDSAAGVEQLMNGDKELSYNSTIIYAGIDPKFGAVNAPFLYSDLKQAEATLAETGLDAYKALSAEHGVELLGFGESGFRQVTNNLRPITQPADLAGIKMRIPGIGLFTDIYRGLGANPTTMNFSEVFTALQQGTIEGQENPVDIVYSSGLAEVQKYLTVWNYVYDPLILGMNKDLFDSLSPEDHQLVTEAAAQANALQIENNRAKEEGELQELSGSMEVNVLDEAQTEHFRQQMTPLYEQYESVWGAELTDAVAPKG